MPSPEERIAGLLLSRALYNIKEEWSEHAPMEIAQRHIEALDAHPLIDVEYLEVVDSISLKQIAKWSDAEEVIACIAAKVGEIRLIDNMTIY